MQQKFNQDIDKVLDSKTFTDFLNVFKVIGFSIYRDKVESSDFSRVHEMMDVIRKLGKNAQGRFTFIFEGYSSNLSAAIGEEPLKGYIAQIAKDYPEIMYYLTYDSTIFVAMCLSNLELRDGKYRVTDLNELRDTVKKLLDAAREYENSLDE